MSLVYIVRYKLRIGEVNPDRRKKFRSFGEAKRFAEQLKENPHCEWHSVEAEIDRPIPA